MTGPEAKAASLAPKIDYSAVGFRCGLEIHQQLDTGKLFSRVRSEVIEPDEVAPRTIGVVDRQLRATGSESGQVDVAAAAEAAKGLHFRYLAISGLTSLVELDEEPPKPMDDAALDVTLTCGALFHSRPVDEVHVMRKTVIDGSNTGGFQRTALVATGGTIAVEGGDVGIWTVAVEEDSARKMDQVQDGFVVYTLDRLGIPLIEVATAPDIKDPAHAQKAAARLGALLRATGRVKRGLGTIRQDLNVSVGVGQRVEIKGCQDLRAVPRVIEQECRRQLWMHHLRHELMVRKASAGQLSDVTAHFTATGAKSVKESLTKGGKVLALPLLGFAGLIKGESKDGPRLGREFADHAKVAAGVKGIFHSDELPAYGLTQGEVDAVRTQLHLGPNDGFALCVEQEAIARRALQAVATRAAAALQPAVQEVRAAQPDDSTRFMRPMPGAARMYPETDVPPIRLTAPRLARIQANLPPLPEQVVEAFQKRHGLSADLAKQLVAEGEHIEVDRLVAAGAEPNLAARTLLQDLPIFQHPQKVRPHLVGVFAAVKAGRFAKEAVPKVLAALDGGAPSVDDAIAKAGVSAADTSVVDAVIAKVIAGRLDFVKEKGAASIGPLMGPVMAELRGKADGAVISERLKAAIAKASS